MKKKLLKSDVLKKLMKYTAATAAVAFIGQEAQAQIIHTDVDPDVTLNTLPSNYQIDFDNDGVFDIDMSYNPGGSWNRIQAIPIGTNTSVVASSGYVAVLNDGDVISSGNSFENSGYGIGLMSAFSSSSYGYSYSYSDGNWTDSNVDDKFIGVKFDISGATHYGWIKVSTSFTSASSMSVTIKEYAYNSVPGESIDAGEYGSIVVVEASAASDIVLADVTDNGNGEDLQVAFTQATDEATLSEYRVLVVKATNAGAFDLAAAEAVVAANYMAVTPNGSDVTALLTATSMDVDGDAVVNDVAYNVFVLSVADGTNATINAISTVSNEITLETILVGEASAASDVVLTDVADNGTGEDLQVAFTQATDEATLSEYRVLVVKATNVGTFDLAAAEAVVAANYMAVTPDGNDVTALLTATSMDVDGDAVANDVAYNVFVLSIADGTNATINAISTVSNEIILETILVVEASAASDVVLTDVADNGTGEDLQVAFTQATDEATLSEYRVLVVKATNAGAFDLAAAEAVVTANYMAVTPDGSDVTALLTATSMDVDGDAVANDVAYNVFVLSVADGTNATINAISTVSNEITLETILVVEASAASDVVLTDVADNGTGEDLQVAFTQAIDEATLSEYRVLVVKATNTGAFDLAAAEAVVAANYMAVTPDGSDVTALLTATSMDVDGDAIANDVAYNVFVLSVADGTNATINAISTVSNEITLETILVVEASAASGIVLTDVDNNGTGEDLQFDFTKASDETTLSEYRVLVVKATGVGAFDLAAAEAVVAANYMAVTPNGSDVSALLTATSMDVDGDAIANDVAYNVFILSVADGTNATVNTLSSVSNEITLDDDTGIEEVAFVSNIFPNPTSEILNIDLESDDTYTVKLTSLTGKVCVVEQFNGSNLKIDVRNLAKSTYVLSIENEDKKMISKKIIVK